MPQNLLEQLREQAIPKRPLKLHQEVRERVNSGLVFLQIADFVLRAMPFAMLTFARAVAALAIYTLTGNYEPQDQQDQRHD